jgi:hypothetical protein
MFSTVSCWPSCRLTNAISKPDINGCSQWQAEINVLCRDSRAEYAIKAVRWDAIPNVIHSNGLKERPALDLVPLVKEAGYSRPHLEAVMRFDSSFQLCREDTNTLSAAINLASSSKFQAPLVAPFERMRKVRLFSSARLLITALA